MKSYELEALGLTREQIRAVQKIHGADLERAKISAANPTRPMIEALTAIAKLLPQDALQNVLVYATTLYNKDKDKNKVKATDDKTTTPERGNDGGSEAPEAIK